jgi:hypothetical protein
MFFGYLGCEIDVTIYPVSVMLYIILGTSTFWDTLLFNGFDA